MGGRWEGRYEDEGRRGERERGDWRGEDERKNRGKGKMGDDFKYNALTLTQRYTTHSNLSAGFLWSKGGYFNREREGDGRRKRNTGREGGR